MAIILSSTANTSTLQTPDAYVQILQPPGYILGVPTDVCAVNGTGSWGPLNQPVLLGQPSDAILNFGRIGTAQITGGASGGQDLHDVVVDCELAFAQAQQSTLQIWAARVSDGTDAKATIAVKDGSGSVTGCTATAVFSGIEGNTIVITFSAGSKTNTFTATVVGFPGGPESETYPNILGGGAGVFWTNFTSAINNGMSGIRGPSKYIKITAPNGSAANPGTSSNNTFTLAGGLDGRTGLTVNNQLGSDSTTPKTGIYAFRNLIPAPSLMWCAGLVDNANGTAQALGSFGDSEGIGMLYTNPTGASTSQAITNKQTWAYDSYNFIPVKDFVTIFDPINAMNRSLPPYAVIAGTTCTAGPHISPLNRPVYSILGTERNDPVTGNIPYSAAEIGQLNAAGILFISKPIPAGNVFGIRTGVNGSSNAATASITYTRMTNFLAKSFAGFIGRYVGQNQTIAKNDPLRAQVRTDFSAFLADLQAKGMIQGFFVQCDLTNNTPTTIAKHYLYALAKVQYMSEVWYFVTQLQGGSTVVFQGSSLGSALAA